MIVTDSKYDKATLHLKGIFAWWISISVLTKMLDFPARVLLEVSQRRHFFAYSEDNLGVRAETTHNSD